MKPGDLINVVLPLRLDWMPTYRIQEGQDIDRGSFVKVIFSGREYTGVVWDRSNFQTREDALPVIEVLGVPRLSGEEIDFWNFISQYYLCSPGEVFRYACPEARMKADMKPFSAPPQSEAPPKPHLSEDEKRCTIAVLDAFQEHKPVLLKGGECRRKIYSALAARVIEEGRSVLILRPFPHKEEYFRTALQYTTDTSASNRSKVIATLRNSPAQFVVGTRQALFLPWKDPGLIIVDDEQSPRHKQSSIAPRINARDCALKLAAIHGADVLLGSASPSLESEFNCRTGKFAPVTLPDDKKADLIIIDTSAEKRKRGMEGAYSKVLLGMMKETLDAKERILLLQPWKDTSDAEIEARKHFPDAGSRINAMPLSEANSRQLEKYSLVALLNAEFLLSRQDFRADERTLQTMEALKGMCTRLAIQTDRANPVFEGKMSVEEMLAERKSFGLPPFTREVRICKAGGKGARIPKATEGESVFLPKDPSLQKKKNELAKEAGYGIIIDVDPA